MRRTRLVSFNLARPRLKLESSHCAEAYGPATEDGDTTLATRG